MQDVILYILNNPESDLKQKTIASKLYMNSSYLSTVFATQTGMRFVDYITTVRLKRAGWLLKNTEMKITEIALRLVIRMSDIFATFQKAIRHCSVTVQVAG